MQTRCGDRLPHPCWSGGYDTTSPIPGLVRCVDCTTHISCQPCTPQVHTACTHVPVQSNSLTARRFTCPSQPAASSLPSWPSHSIAEGAPPPFPTYKPPVDILARLLHYNALSLHSTYPRHNRRDHTCVSKHASTFEVLIQHGLDKQIHARTVC